MNIVVTGATSFIGTAAVRRLLQAGHEVCAVVRPMSANRKNLENQIPQGCRGRIRILELDMQQIAQIAGQIARPADGWLHICWEGAGSDNRTLRDVQQANVAGSLKAVRTAAAGVLYLPGRRRSMGSAMRRSQRIIHAIRCQNTARPRQILPPRQNRSAGNWEWIISMPGFSACMVRVTTPGLWCSPVCGPGSRGGR